MGHAGSVSHHPDSGRRLNGGTLIHVHFFSYGMNKAARPAADMPVILSIDLRKAIPPPKMLCYHFTGKDPKIIDDFWSHPLHQRLYTDALHKIDKSLKRLNPGMGKDVAVLVNCSAGNCSR